MGLFSAIGTAIGGIGGFIVGGPAGAVTGAKIGSSVGGIGDSISGGNSAANASSNASAAQVAAQNAAIGEQRRQFDATQKNLQPFVQTGTAANQKISDLLLSNTRFDPNSIPGYTASLDAGLSAAERSGFAHGDGLSGRTLASLEKVGQQGAYSAFNNYVSQLSNQATRGENAGANVGSIGAGTSANISQLLSNIGDARASGIIGSNNAQQQASNNVSQGISSLLSSVGNLFQPTSSSIPVRKPVVAPTLLSVN